MRVRVSAIQYMLRPITGFDDFAQHVAFFVHAAKEYGSQFVLFPEFFTMQLLSYLREHDPARAVRRLAELTPEYQALFTHLAVENDLYVIAGTHPVEDDGLLYNAAHLFTPHGQVLQQRKVHLTRSENGPYQMARGDGFCVFDTDYGRIAILVCYDVEFPEAARLVAEAGAQLIFVPSCTDDRQGYWRVRYCAQARAIENQVYVAMTGTVGNLPHVPHMATNYSQAVIMTPSDFSFAQDGIAAEGIVNQEQLVVADVDLTLLNERRLNGTVVPLLDKVPEAYHRVERMGATSSGGAERSALAVPSL